jgi:phage portal protein BeeE
MSPIEAAAKAIDIHNAAGGWNKALLDNAARPSGGQSLSFRAVPPRIPGGARQEARRRGRASLLSKNAWTQSPNEGN